MKLALSLSICLGTIVSAAEAPSALTALKILPPAAANRLAMIDGHEGAPVPERWHFLVQDPTAANGLREFVIAEREIVAEREVSQFATSLTPAEVLGNGAVKIDSSTVGKLVERYAAANEMPVTSMNFRLRKDELTGKPTWVVACTDAQGGSLGTLVVDGTDGRVLGHEGFAQVPPSPKVKAPTVSRLARNSEPGSLPPVYEGPRDDRRIPVRRAEAVRPASQNPLSLLRRLLPF